MSPFVTSHQLGLLLCDLLIDHPTIAMKHTKMLGVDRKSSLPVTMFWPVSCAKKTARLQGLLRVMPWWFVLRCARLSNLERSNEAPANIRGWLQNSKKISPDLLRKVIQGKQELNIKSWLVCSEEELITKHQTKGCHRIVPEESSTGRRRMEA